MSAFHLCLRNEKYHKDKIITMRYRKAGLFNSKEVKVDSSLRAPFKEFLNVLSEIQITIIPKNFVSEIGITWTEEVDLLDLEELENAEIKVHFVEGYMKEPLVISIQNCRVFFKALSLELGFQPALGEQHLKGLPQPQFFAKVHSMIAIHALGVTPNKTANL